MKKYRIDFDFGEFMFVTATSPYSAMMKAKSNVPFRYPDYCGSDYKMHATQI